MGKTETGRLFARLGIPIFDSDAAVAELYGRGGAAVKPVAEVFPDAVIDGRVDRSVLARRLTADPEAFSRLESIVHPLVRQARDAFVRAAGQRGDPLVILDIPLLFESGAEKSVDAIVVVSAPAAVQESRVLARPGMTREKLALLNARQLSDSEKRAKADFVIETDRGLAQAFDDVRRVAAALLERARNRQADA